MQFTTLALALTSAAFATAQGVTAQIKPDGAAPSGCSATYNGEFQITVYNVSSNAAKRDLSKRQASPSTCAQKEGALIMTLQDGILKDGKQRIGYIAENYQFQFDGPPQTGAIYTAGFSACSNGSLALGSSEVFYRCRSGSFYNLYNKNWAPQCEEVAIGVVPCGGSSSPAPASASAPAVTQASDAQPANTGSAVAPPVSQITDGQPQGASAAPAPPVVSQLSDGQPQAPSPVPVSQIGDGQPQAPASAPAPAPTAASNGTASPAPSVAPFTGAASSVVVSSSFAGVLAAIAAIALL